MTPLKKTTIGIVYYLGYYSSNFTFIVTQKKDTTPSTLEMWMRMYDLGSNFSLLISTTKKVVQLLHIGKLGRMFFVKNIGLGVQYNGGLNTFGSYEPSWLGCMWIVSN